MRTLFIVLILIFFAGCASTQQAGVWDKANEATKKAASTVEIK